MVPLRENLKGILVCLISSFGEALTKCCMFIDSTAINYVLYMYLILIPGNLEIHQPENVVFPRQRPDELSRGRQVGRVAEFDHPDIARQSYRLAERLSTICAGKVTRGKNPGFQPHHKSRQNGCTNLAEDVRQDETQAQENRR